MRHVIRKELKMEKKIKFSYFECILLFSFTLIALSIVHLAHDNDGYKDESEKKVNVFGHIYFMIRKIIIGIVKIKRIILHQSFVINVNQKESKSTNDELLKSYDERINKKDFKVQDEEKHDFNYQKVLIEEKNQNIESNNIGEIMQNVIVEDNQKSISNNDTDNKKDKQLNFENDLYNQNTESETLNEKVDNVENEMSTQPVSPKIIDESEPIIVSEIIKELKNISKRIKHHKKKSKEVLSSISKKFNEIFVERETEVDAFLSQIRDDNGALKHKMNFFLPDKYFLQFKNVPLPKISNDMWIGSGRNVDFLISFPNQTVMNKISFGYVPNNDCVINQFYLKIKIKNNYIETPVFQLKLQTPKRQNFSLSFPIKSEKFYLIPITNYGNKTHFCLPDFKVYQKIGFLYE